MEPQYDNSHIKQGMKMLFGLVFMTAIFFTGVYLGYQNRPTDQKIISLVNNETPEGEKTDFTPFWKAWQIVSEKLPGSENITSEERMYGAIKGMMSSFKDPYTTFFTPEETTIFESQISGEFDGIGIEIGEKDEILTVIAPLKDTPADRAGIKSGDKIVKIDDKVTTNISIDQAISLIRGTAGTSVALTIFREGFTEPKIFSVVRERISLPTVDTETRPQSKTFIIHLYNFSAQSPKLFADALEKYLASGYPNLVLDMRGNPGGYLDAAVTIAGWFVPEGKVIVKEIGKTEADVVMHTSKGPVIFPKISKLVVLVDQGSASASEILAGALSEYGVGILAGEKTFGKGSVQEVIKLTNNTSLKVTVAKWYTPNGVSISDSGLVPTHIIRQSREGKTDTQLEAAIALFRQ